ncbi:MAG: hypothetical protein RL634_89 [Bacteroidota bacterium]|jgi:toxin HigB-1
MIISFGSRATRAVWNGVWAKELPNDIQNIARRKLRMINNAQNLQDLISPPSNHLEKLKGNLSQFYSIRINIQWRIIFMYSNGNASRVEIIDYHK